MHLLTALAIAFQVAGPSPIRVRIETPLGNIEAEIDSAKAPRTAANFLQYVDAGAYDKGQFHRTVRADNQPNDTVRIAVIQASVDSRTRIARSYTDRARAYDGDGAAPCGRDVVDGAWRAGHGDVELLHLYRRSAGARLWWSSESGWPGVCGVRARHSRYGRREEDPGVAGAGSAVDATGRDHTHRAYSVIVIPNEAMGRSFRTK